MGRRALAILMALLLAGPIGAAPVGAAAPPADESGSASAEEVAAEAFGPCTTPSFLRKLDVSVGRRATSVAVGDFNRDGNQDLAVTNGGAVSVLLGTGTGRSGFDPGIPMGQQAQFVATGRHGREDALVPLHLADDDPGESGHVRQRLRHGPGGLPGQCAGEPVAGGV